MVVVGGREDVLCQSRKNIVGGRPGGGKEKGRMRRLPADNEIKPISVE